MISKRGLVRGVVLVCLATTVVAGAASEAQATWGPNGECGVGETHHCYALAEHRVSGGALASIVFVYSMAMNIPKSETSAAFSSHEQWISFDSEPSGWIETGQAGGYPYGCCSLHPFYAEKLKGVYKETLSSGTVEGYTYNHYVLYDSERNGRWHIYWGCCEVGYYGGGWPEKFNEQEAGVEAADEEEPSSWMRDEVAWSQGGEWFPWAGAKNFTKGLNMCLHANPESSAAGNIGAGTIRGGKEVGQC